MCFANFPFHLPKVPHVPRKSEARSYEVLRLSRKIISANLKIWRSKMQPISGNLRPDRLTSLMNMSLVLCLARDMHLCRSSSNDRCLPMFLKLLQTPRILLTFGKVENPLRLPHKTTLQRPKMVRACGAFNMFYFQTSFAPQHRALFQHLNFQKCSEDDAFCTFWLLLPQRRALFEHLNFEKCSENGELLYILTSTRASCQKGHFFHIPTSKNVLSMQCF